MAATIGQHHIVLVGDDAEGSPSEVELPISVIASVLPSTGGGGNSTTISLATLVLAAGVACVGLTRRRI